jgi:entericidin A
MLPGLNLFKSSEIGASPIRRSSRTRNEIRRRDFFPARRDARRSILEETMRKLLGVAMVAGMLMISACNTIEGAGKDVSSAGNTVAKTANDAK